MVDFLFLHLPKIWTLVSALAGGGIVAAVVNAYRAYHEQSRLDDDQSHEHRSHRVSEQSKRIDSLLDRMKHVEQKQEAERKARVEAEVENKRLKAMIEAMSTKIDQLVKMVEDLREEAGMKPLSDKEKDDLKSTPDFTSNDRK